MIDLRVKLIDDNAVLPKQNLGDAGMDLTATSIDITEKYVEYCTGICMSIPEGYVGLLFPRSSISKYDLSLTNSVGVIDSSYRGEIKARFKITFDSSGNLYKVGERCCQLIIMPYPRVDVVQVDELSETNRGQGGFGSTGH
tara:strand:- start:2366 stop:2788 length:423 start_codon:yes stop_codon:yes gene_type:complete